MRIKSDHVFQFKISIKDIKPPVWRRIVVPCDFTFWDLHVAIQDAFGWLDCHLHEFTVRAPVIRRDLSIGIPDDEGYAGEDYVLPGWAILLAHHFTLANRRATYTYDFGDNWRHDVYLEKVTPRDKTAAFPQCIGGRRAGPIEDCGGPGGYDHLLKVLADSKHEEHETMLEWVGDAFNPGHFDKSEVEFDDSTERLDRAFGDIPEPSGPPDLRVIQGGGNESSSRGDGEGKGWHKVVTSSPQDLDMLRVKAGEGFRGFPIATVVLYGPDDKRATKIVVGIMETEDPAVSWLERWIVDDGDIRENSVVVGEIQTFIQKYGVLTVALGDRIMGCPHEEGIDYPAGETCPQCPFWASRDRWTGPVN